MELYDKRASRFASIVTLASLSGKFREVRSRPFTDGRIRSYSNPVYSLAQALSENHSFFFSFRKLLTNKWKESSSLTFSVLLARVDQGEWILQLALTVDVDQRDST